MPNFNGVLNANSIYSPLYNMIISQEVFSDNVKGTYSSLVDRARVDGQLFADTKLFYSADVLESHPWGADSEAANLLELDRPEAPEVQAITIDVFRQIRLTLDNYLTKQAWMDGNSFSSFSSVMVQMMSDTKRIYDSALYNTFIGTTETAIGKQTQTVQVPADADTGNVARTFARNLANQLTELKDITYDYNDYRHTRSYDESDFIVVWNAEVYNELKYVDLPVIFHKEGLLGNFEQVALPAHYFGTVAGASGTDTTEATNTTVFSLVVKNYAVASQSADPRAKKAKDGTWYVHVLPGQLLPNSVEYNKNEAYIEDQTIAYKIMHKRSVPYCSAFSVGTEFVNPRALVTTRFLTFGHNTLEYLKNYPFITVRSVDQA